MHDLCVHATLRLCPSKLTSRSRASRKSTAYIWHHTQTLHELTLHFQIFTTTRKLFCSLSLSLSLFSLLFYFCGKVRRSVFIFKIRFSVQIISSFLFFSDGFFILACGVIRARLAFWSSFLPLMWSQACCPLYSQSWRHRYILLKSLSSCIYALAWFFVLLFTTMSTASCRAQSVKQMPPSTDWISSLPPHPRHPQNRKFIVLQKHTASPE